jgi:hypothetical protein
MAQGETSNGQRKIPILVSDHHADHALYLLRHFNNENTTLVVLDAHADTETNPEYNAIRTFVLSEDYSAADNYIKNHNWIHPLTPNPVNSLIWIDKISGFPDAYNDRGFRASTSSWNIKNIAYINTDEIDNLPAQEGSLFISIDLDFFYNEDYTPQDIPFVFNRLLDYVLGWEGTVVWAICLSRAWLPSDEYAWTLLEQSLRWLKSRTEFESPELTIFTSYRHDTSRKALSFRTGGTEPPGFYSKENEIPATMRDLFCGLEK